LRRHCSLDLVPEFCACIKPSTRAADHPIPSHTDLRHAHGREHRAGLARQRCLCLGSRQGCRATRTLAHRTHGLGLGGVLLHVTLPSPQRHTLIDPRPLPARSTITHLSPGLVGTQRPRSSRMRLPAGPSLSLTVAHTGSPPQFRCAAHRGRRAPVLPPTLGVLPPTALVCLLVVLDLSRPEAYSPGRFSGGSCGTVALRRLYEGSEARGEVSGGAP